MNPGLAHDLNQIDQVIDDVMARERDPQNARELLRWSFRRAAMGTLAVLRYNARLAQGTAAGTSFA